MLFRPSRKLPQMVSGLLEIVPCEQSPPLCAGREGLGDVTDYPCVASSLAGFIQQIAVGYVGRGYWFYVTGEIPAHKDPEKTDAKIINQYGIAVSKWARARRKRAGLANLQYLRFERIYVIL